jgi:hypothetical protein
MHSFGKKDSDYLYRTRVTQDNIQASPEIAAALAEKGFTADRLQEGLTLHSAAEQAFRTLVDRRRSWKAMGTGVAAKFMEVYNEYIGHIERLRADLNEDPETADKLDLNGKRKRFIGGVIEQLTQFYNRSINDPDVSAAILVFGFTPEVIQESFNRFLEFQAMRSEYEKLKGECQKLVVEKDLAIRRLRAWMRSLTKTARVVFADNLQTLEEIGLFVRNNPKPAVEETPAETGEQAPAESEVEGTGTDTGAGA